MLIDDQEHARRLARAIVADIILYNRDRLQSAQDPIAELADEVQEGRALFEARVAPRLYGLFENALDALRAMPSPQSAPPFAPPATSAPHPSPPDHPPFASLQRENPPPRSTGLWFGIALVIAALVATGTYLSMNPR